MIIDKFGKKQPYNSWVLKESWIFGDTEKTWEAPVAYPNDFRPYTWDEDNQEWVLLNN